MRTLLFLAVWLSAITFFCSCRGVPRLREDGAAGEPLPEFFGPVTWDSTEADLRTSFPEAQVYNRDFDTQVPDTLGMLKLEGARLMPFGDARVRLLRRGGVPTGVLVIEYIDNSLVTCLEAPEEFDDCRERLVRERHAVFDALAGPLRSRYGPASVDPHFGSDETEGQDPQQFSLSWKRPGYTLQLGTGQEPSGHTEWTVRLAAIRDPDYPFW